MILKRFIDNFMWFLLGLAFVALLLPAISNAQTVNVWYPVQSGQWRTAAWDPVTQCTDGTPLPAATDAKMSYNVYAKNYKTNAVIAIASGITTTSQQIVLPAKASYLVGVEAQLLYTGETVPIKSPISWSNDSTVCFGGQTFGLQFQTGPQNPKGLK